jgi:hypothetical protein
MPVAPNTSASMILRTTPPTPNTSYSIYNLGQNKILAGQSVLSGIGDWDFAGPGAVNWDFDGNFTDLWVKRPTTIEIMAGGGTTMSVPVNEFLVYNISGNVVLPNAFVLGDLGRDWQVAGFGYLFRSDFGQADMVVRSVTNNTATYLAYDTKSNQFIDVVVAARVGTDWNTAGFGTYTTNAINDPNNFAGLMFLKQSGTGTMLAYAFRDGKLVNATGSLPDSTGKTANAFAAVGQDIVGFGKFASGVPLGMITRGTDNTFRIYDIVQNFDTTGAPFYTAQLPNPNDVNSGILIPSSAGVNSNLKFVGFAPIAGNSPVEAPFTDMVLRDTNPASTTFGTFYFYDIKDDALGPSGPLPQPPSPSAPIDSAWAVGGIAPDFSSTGSAGSAGSTSQLVQAMAGFGGGSGAAAGLNAVPLGTETLQQPLLTTPQHA